MMPELPTIDICIVTYKRPDLLQQLLESLFRQKTEGAFAYSIIVIDNDKEKTAAPIVKEIKNSGINIVYDNEPQQNISLARNRALQHVTGQYVASIDDDERATDRWLLHLFRATLRFEADVVIGRVISDFPEGTSEVIKKSRVFALPAPPTGSTGNFVYSTNNCLFKSKLLTAGRRPFDPNFGRTGGEDTLFFTRLKKRGIKMVFCKEAVVRENIPSERTTVFWLLKRYFRNGHITYLIAKEESNGSAVSSFYPSAYRYGRLMLKTAKKLMHLRAQRLVKRVDNRQEAAEMLQDIAFYCGFLMSFTGFRYRSY